MPAHMISYDLSRPGQEYSDLYQAIKDLAPAWWHHLESTWIVITSKGTTEIAKSLTPHLDANDKLLVTTLSGPWTSWGLPDRANEWLQNNL